MVTLELDCLLFVTFLQVKGWDYLACLLLSCNGQVAHLESWFFSLKLLIPVKCLGTLSFIGMEMILKVPILAGVLW